jgi:KUP system potassium uptake protein
MKAIVGDDVISPMLIIGAVSCIFWTLTLQTTIKYVIITLRADNNGEGGIFSLYALIRRAKFRYLAGAAIVGGSALLADSIITPPISVSSAIEGLKRFNITVPTETIVIAIITMLFFIQQFGTKLVGRFFGPVMLIWFLMLGLFGFSNLLQNLEILKAINPYYAISLITKYPNGFWLLGAVFLCTTGAEALYSDLGHCGRQNIRVSWAFVKTCLLLNYFGQGAWLLNRNGFYLTDVNPFYELMPSWFLLPGIIIATAAAIVASQALISGSFTLINEAIRLNFGPKLKIIYPTDLRGQLYVPSVNWMLWLGCVGVVLYFKESSNMEAAYGLAIIITMISTTILLSFYLYIKKVSVIFIGFLVLLFGTVEISFLIANLSKFSHGGWITLMLSGFLMTLMTVWYMARKIKNRFVEFTKIEPYLPLIRELSKDMSIPKFSTHLVYLTSANRNDEIESKVIYSILQKLPKRSDVYWFLHVDVLDVPYKMEYKIITLANGRVIKIDFRLGFRVEPRINLMFRQVVQEMVENKEVDITSRYSSLNSRQVIGDFRFIVMEKFLSNDNDLPFMDKLIMDLYFIIKHFGLSEERAFGLDTSSVLVEKVPMVIQAPPKIKLQRVE